MGIGRGRVRRWLAGLSCGALLAGVAPAAAQDATGTISGAVSAETTGLPLADVCVTATEILSQGGQAREYQAVTNLLGRYSVTAPPADYRIDFRPCVPSQYSYVAELWDDALSWADAEPVSVQAGAAVTGIDAALADAPTSYIAGTLRNERGGPLEDGCVTVYESDDYGMGGSAAVGPDGAYAVYGLEPGSYKIEFQHCGFPYRQYRYEYWAGPAVDGTIHRELAAVITLAEDEGRHGIDGALRPPGTASLSGEVTAEDTGEPLSWVCVEVFDVADPRYPVDKVVIGEAGGAWQAGYLDAGTYTVKFSGCGSAPRPASEWWSEQPTFGTAARIVLVGGEQRTGIDERMPRHARDDAAISGQVFDAATGHPVGGICVQAHRLSRAEDPAPGMRTDPDGWYHIGGLQSEDYAVSFNACAAAHPDYPAEYWDDRPFLEAAWSLPVRVGWTWGAINAELGSTACPRGEVPPAAYDDVDEDNLHRPGIDCMTWHEVATGAGDGRFRPRGGVTRAQMAAFVARTLSSAGVALPSDPPDAFRDDDGHHFELEIDQLAALGIVRGDTSRQYRPDDPVTRAAMATYLVRAYDVAAPHPAESAGDRFEDDAGRTHESNINRAAAAGLVQGTGGGRFQPDARTRRDQMTSMLSRLLDELVQP